MQHLAADDEMKEMLRNIARNLTPEDRLVIIKNFTLEQRLEGLAPEDRLVGLTAEEREQLLALLQQQQTAPKAQKGKRGKKA